MYDATSRGGRSAEIDGKRTAGHDINADREGFASHSACPFLAPFSSVSHTLELGRCLKINTLGNRKYVFLRVSFTPSTSGIQIRQKNATLDVGQHYTNSSSRGMICTNRLMNPTERITNRATEKISDLPTYDIWSLGCILYHRLFGSPLCNFDCQKINSLIYFLYTIYSISLQYLCFYFKISQAYLKMMRI